MKYLFQFIIRVPLTMAVLGSAYSLYGCLRNYDPSQASSYQVGDCLSLSDSAYVHKVVEVGKYGLRTIKPHYDSVEEFNLNVDDLKKAHKMDCFNLFEPKGK